MSQPTGVLHVTGRSWFRAACAAIALAHSTCLGCGERSPGGVEPVPGPAATSRSAPARGGAEAGAAAASPAATEPESPGATTPGPEPESSAAPIVADETPEIMLPPQPPPQPPAQPPAQPTPPPAPSLDEVYAEVLATAVSETGLVRYDRLADPAVRAKLDAVVAGLGARNLPASTPARIALWCNAYNANVLAAALRESRRPGFTTVKDVPGFFDKAMITVAGETVTLNDLENQRLRPLGDPRIHAALVCAAMSCPPLRREPFRASGLDEQLDDQCRRWINDPNKFRVSDGRLGLSQILNWYGADFDRQPYGNATGFVLAYAEPGGPLARLIINSDKVETTWIPYDWRLNRAPEQ